MLSAKLDQPVRQLRLAPRLLGNLQTAQCGELYVDIADLSCTLADSVQHFQQLLLVAIRVR